MSTFCWLSLDWILTKKCMCTLSIVLQFISIFTKYFHFGRNLSSHKYRKRVLNQALKTTTKKQGIVELRRKWNPLLKNEHRYHRNRLKHIITSRKKGHLIIFCSKEICVMTSRHGTFSAIETPITKTEMLLIKCVAYFPATSRYFTEIGLKLSGSN